MILDVTLGWEEQGVLEYKEDCHPLVFNQWQAQMILQESCFKASL